MMGQVLFKDRSDAGRQLADRLAASSTSNAFVLGIPRGGVPVAAKVAELLHAPMDVIVPRKIPIPWNPDAGFGAVTADGTMILNESMIRHLGMSRTEISHEAKLVREEVARRTREYRGTLPPPDLAGIPVIIVDDGLASGYTMLAAVKSVRKQRPSSVIVAVPVASGGAARMIADQAEEFVALIVSERLPFAVADFYAEWRDVTDAEVKQAVAATRSDRE